MVAIEAAAVGTPTVAFDVGEVSGAILPSGGELVDSEQYRLLNRPLLHHLQNADATSKPYREHAARFAWPHFSQEIRRLVYGIKPRKLTAGTQGD